MKPQDPAGHSIAIRRRCPGCGEREFRCLFDIPYSDDQLETFLREYYHKPPDTRPVRPFSYQLVICNGCELVYQTNVPGENFLPILYDQWISPGNFEKSQQTKTLTEFSRIAAEIHFLIRALDMKPGQIQTLDFGMGWSRWSNMARAYGCRAAGVEISTERQNYARSIGLEVFDYNDLPQETFHFVNVEQVLEHLADPMGTLKHLLRCLRPQGLIRLSVPDATKTLKVLPKEFSALSPAQIMPIQPLEHVNSFTPRTLECFGTMSGLEVFRPSLKLLYEATSGWFSRDGLKALARPIYRHVWPKTTIVYFRKP